MKNYEIKEYREYPENTERKNERKNGQPMDKIPLEAVTIRTELRPGDAGYITYLHASIYTAEYGFRPVFEAYVLESFCPFIKNYDPKRDRLWCAEHNGNIVGSIAIVGHGDRAQIRWFLIDPRYRNIGLGKTLLTKAMAFAREKQYSEIFLYTTTGLDRALSMYEKAGFQLVSEKPNDIWRDGLKELEFAMKL